MKITTFNPMILTLKAEEVIKLFEELGFEVRHSPTIGTGENQVTNTRMKNADGFSIDILEVGSLPRPAIPAIRMNVDDFDEAYAILKEHGFTEAPGAFVSDTRSAKALLMLSPSRFLIDLVQHKIK